MKKFIYIIKNDINNKVYIGQAVDVKKRFQSHCTPSAYKRNGDLVGRAIQKYGKNHFICEILCSACDDYNEKEKFYIKKFNSLAPNGYNVNMGGENPPIMSGTAHPEAILSESQVSALTRELKYTNTSFVELAKKYKYSSNGMISAFNMGKTYYRDYIDYPIRKDVYNGKLSKKDVDNIIKRLKTSYDSYETIAKDYGVYYTVIAKINKGLFHHKENEDYPIRESKPRNISAKITYDKVTKIIELLLTTGESLHKISKICDVAYKDVIDIKNGNIKMYRRKGLTYPLRKNN